MKRSIDEVVGKIREIQQKLVLQQECQSSVKYANRILKGHPIGYRSHHQGSQENHYYQVRLPQHAINIG